MGGRQASETLLGIRLQQMEKGGTHISQDQQQALLEEIRARYDAEVDPYLAAAHLWIDELIDPRDTRAVIATGIGMADRNPELPHWSPGVIQT
jgi:acetyl-CoA carboxylase carboxyltransferase component